MALQSAINARSFVTCKASVAPGQTVVIGHHEFRSFVDVLGYFIFIVGWQIQQYINHLQVIY